MRSGTPTDPSRPSSLGAFLIDVTSLAGQASPRSVLSFAEGGVLAGIASDVANTTFLGQWTADANGFVGTYVSFGFDATGTFEGTAEITVTGRVSGDQISGTYSANGKTPDGGEYFPPDHGTFEGRRVRPQGGNL